MVFYVTGVCVVVRWNFTTWGGRGNGRADCRWWHGKKNAVWGGGRWLELWKGRKPDCVSLYFVYGSYRMVHVWQQVL